MAEKVRHASSGERDRAISRLAEHQYGVVAGHQLRALGVSRRTLDRWLANKRLHQLNGGAYSLGHPLVSQRARWLAGVLACGQGAALSHVSAAALWGLARGGQIVDVSSPRGNQGSVRWPRIRLHRGQFHDADERVVKDRIPVTSVARTLFDLAEVESFERLERAWEEADRLRLLQLGEVERVCERGYGRRALKPIRRLLAAARATRRTRSPLEDRFQRFCRHYSLPPHRTNVTVLDSEVDVLWAVAKLIVELDSWEFHGHRAAFQRDRARDTRLLVAGYRTVRVTHDRLDTEAPTLAQEILHLLRG